MQKKQPGSAGNEPAYPIASVDNALRLLLLLRQQPRIRLMEASAHLGVAHSTAHRLLAMLAYHDFVRQENGQRSYVAGPALVEIGLAAVRNMDLRNIAREVLEELAGTFDETVHLSQLEGTSVRYLDAIESKKALRVASRTGTTLFANCTASGKAMLARLDDSEVKALFSGHGPLPASTGRSITARWKLLDELAGVRQRGYAVNDQESEEGVASIAAAVHNEGGAALGALSVSAPVSRVDEARIAEIGSGLREAADGLMELLQP